MANETIRLLYKLRKLKKVGVAEGGGAMANKLEEWYCDNILCAELKLFGNADKVLASLRFERDERGRTKWCTVIFLVGKIYEGSSR